MKLENGYKVIYEAANRVTEEKPGKFYASKGVPAIDDAMLISYNNGTEYVDLKSFKLIYSDGTHLLGSVSGIPDRLTDVNIVIKAGDEIVFGEILDTNVEEETPVATAPKTTRKRKVEAPVEEAPVEE